MLDREAISKALAMKPMLWIGKNGINSNVIQELNKLLKKKGVVKVKLLRSFISENSKKEAFQRLIDESGAIAVKTIGFTIVLSRR